MLSNISLNVAGNCQEMMINLLKFVAKEAYIPTTPLGVAVAIGDVTVETLKYPCMIIEHIAFAAINLVGILLCRDNCHLKDGIENLRKIVSLSAVDVPMALILAIPRLLMNLYSFVVDNPKNWKSCNDKADFHSNSKLIINNPLIPTYYKERSYI